MSDEQIRAHFANKLRELREAAGLSQEELGEKIGCSRGSISFYEKSQRVPDIIILKKASDFFNVSPAYLLGMGIKSPDPEAEIAVRYTGLCEHNIDFLNKCTRIQKAEKNSITDSAIIPEPFLDFINEIIDLAQSNTQMIADYDSLDVYTSQEAMVRLGPVLCRDMVRFKAAAVARAVEDHLSRRGCHGND